MNPQRFLAAAIGSALAASAFADVNTLPAGEQLRAGTATVSRSGPNMEVNQSTSRAILDWQTFSIGSGASVEFKQPDASSIALNRVVGNNPSEIFGRLTANGQVFLSNPSGVLFAPSASVEVGALFATTLSISDENFMAGRYVFSNAGNAGEVVNQGSIVTPNGYAALAGPKVRNDGVIVAQLGTVALAAGDRVTLDMIGDGLINVSVDQAAVNALALNTGTIEANGGRVLMRAASANQLLDTVINNTGTLRATRLEQRNGEIILDAPTGIVRSTGTLEADSMVINATEAYVDLAQSPGGPITGGGEVIAPFPDTITVSDPGQITIDGTFSISAGSLTQFVQTGTNAVSLGLQTGSTGTVSAFTGSIVVTNNVGLLAPLNYSIVGTGIMLPREAIFGLQ